MQHCNRLTLDTWRTLHATALFAEGAAEAVGAAGTNVNWVVVLQFTKAVLALVAVSQIVAGLKGY